MSYQPAQDNYQALIKEKLAANHFTNHIGFELIRMIPGECEGRIAIVDHLKQQLGFLHGGVTMTVADIAMGIAAFTLVKDGEQVVTANLLTNFLNPVEGEFLYARGYVIKAGKKLYYCEAELWTIKNNEKILVAKTSSSMAVVETAVIDAVKTNNKAI
jgi:uncharacterized protein (TIGR00369 family)